MTTDAQKRASRKYNAANTKQVIIRLNKRTDADILETLAACVNVQGYIKALIRADVSAPTEDGNAR